MVEPNCLVFPDGGDWIVYAPVSRLAFRANETVARRFQSFQDTGTLNGVAPMASPPRSDHEHFAPKLVTVVTSSMCGQACGYCYASPAHNDQTVLQTEFCRAALEFAASGAADAGQALRVFFHGLGEPTFAWSVFEECVDAAIEVAESSRVPLHLRLCTGGQLTGLEALWIAERFDQIDLSLDGPRDIQNRQRPRKDGRDSFDGPERLAGIVLERGRKLAIKMTVTRASVDRVPESVEFVARSIGPASLQIAMPFSVPYLRDEMCGPPAWQDYVPQFGKALDVGARYGVDVGHPHISYESLRLANPGAVCAPFCLVPPATISAFYDEPKGNSPISSLGAYGGYDAGRRTIRFDYGKRSAIERSEPATVCRNCPCGVACIGTGGVRGRVPMDIPKRAPECQARLGVLKELVRRVTPRRAVEKECVAHE